MLGPEHPDTLLSVNNLAGLLYSKGDYAGAEPLYRRALESRERVLGPEYPDTLLTMKELAELLEKTGQVEEALALKRRFNLTQSKDSAQPPLTLRQLALKCFNIGDYPQAIMLLERLLEQKFEVPGTHCHLARIFLLTDRDDEAIRHVAEAWAHRSEAPPYVVPRILWLQLGLSLMQGIDARSLDSASSTLLGRLKTALQALDAHMEWTMDPVLEHLRPKLSGESHALLTALVAALSNRDAMDGLEVFQEWRDQPPLPPDD